MEKINHPAHYGGADSAHEAIEVIIEHNLDFCLGNVVKYVLRAGKKPFLNGTERLYLLEDLKKARWYLNHKIKLLEEENDTTLLPPSTFETFEDTYIDPKVGSVHIKDELKVEEAES